MLISGLVLPQIIKPPAPEIYKAISGTPPAIVAPLPSWMNNGDVETLPTWIPLSDRYSIDFSNLTSEQIETLAMWEFDSHFPRIIALSYRFQSLVTPEATLHVCSTNSAASALFNYGFRDFVDGSGGYRIVSTENTDFWLAAVLRRAFDDTDWRIADTVVSSSENIYLTTERLDRWELGLLEYADLMSDKLSRIPNYDSAVFRNNLLYEGIDREVQVELLAPPVSVRVYVTGLLDPANGYSNFRREYPDVQLSENARQIVLETISRDIFNITQKIYIQTVMYRYYYDNTMSDYIQKRAESQRDLRIKRKDNRRDRKRMIGR